FDMKTNTVTLSGNVVVTQGQNVLRGERLIVDLTSGVSRVEGGRGQGFFLPHSQHDQRQPGDKEPARPTTSSPFPGNSPAYPSPLRAVDPATAPAVAGFEP